MIRRGLYDDLELPYLDSNGEPFDLLTVDMSDFHQTQRERAKESQINRFCPPQMLKRERSFDTLESMRAENDSDSDDDMHFSQEGIAEVLREHESWTDDDDVSLHEKVYTDSPHSTPKLRAESPPTWLDYEDIREGEIPELRLSAGTPSEQARLSTVRTIGRSCAVPHCSDARHQRDELHARAAQRDSSAHKNRLRWQKRQCGQLSGQIVLAHTLGTSACSSDAAC